MGTTIESTIEINQSFHSYRDYSGKFSTFLMNEVINTIDFFPYYNASDCYTSIATGVGNLVTLFPIDGGNVNMNAHGHRDKILFIRSFDSDKIITASNDGAINLWQPNLDSNQWINYLSNTRKPISGLEISRSLEGCIVSITKEGYFTVWDKTSLMLKTSLCVDRKGLYSVALLDSDNLIILGGMGRIYLYDSCTYDHVTTLGDHAGPIHSMTCILDNTIRQSFLYTGGEDKVINMWNLNTFSIVRKLIGHVSSVTCLDHISNYDCMTDSNTFSVDSSTNTLKRNMNIPLIVSGSRDKTIRIWKSSNGELLYVFRGHDERINALATFVDSSTSTVLLLSTSYDKTIKLWYVHKLLNWERRRNFAMFLSHYGFSHSPKQYIYHYQSEMTIMHEQIGSIISTSDSIDAIITNVIEDKAISESCDISLVTIENGSENIAKSIDMLNLNESNMLSEYKSSICNVFLQLPLCSYICKFI